MSEESEFSCACVIIIFVIIIVMIIGYFGYGAYKEMKEREKNYMECLDEIGKKICETENLTFYDTLRETIGRSDSVRCRLPESRDPNTHDLKVLEFYKNETNYCKNISKLNYNDGS